MAKAKDHNGCNVEERGKGREFITSHLLGEVNSKIVLTGNEWNGGRQNFEVAP